MTQPIPGEAQAGHHNFPTGDQLAQIEARRQAIETLCDQCTVTPEGVRHASN